MVHTVQEVGTKSERPSGTLQKHIRVSVPKQIPKPTTKMNTTTESGQVDDDGRRRRRSNVETTTTKVVIPENVGRDVKIMVVRRLAKYSDDTFMTDGEQTALSPSDEIVTRDATLVTVINGESDVIQSAKDLISSDSTPTHLD